MFKRFCIVVIFGIAFGYIEAAVVVYLRAISHPNGFTFPLDFAIDPFSKRILLTEIGREAATILLILTGALLFGRNRQQRFAYFLTIFAVWDIFYYVWLKVILGWPASLMDWDILFLIPHTWASPVLAPIIISFSILIFAIIILYRDVYAKPLKVSWLDWFAFVISAIIIVAIFCIAGRHVTKPNYDSYFYWPLFAVGWVLAVAAFLRCFMCSKRLKPEG
jgi:hypothetical protein